MINGKKNLYRVYFITKKGGDRAWMLDLEAVNAPTAIKEAKERWKEQNIEGGKDWHLFTPSAWRLNDFELFSTITEVNSRSIVFGFKAEFKSAEEMEKAVRENGTMYNVTTGDYILPYNTNGVIRVYNINPKDAAFLQRLQFRDSGLWNRYIHDDNNTYRAIGEYCKEVYDKGKWLLI